MSQGADVNESDARGITALGLAVGYNKVALVKVLLDGGADVSKTDAKGSTVLHYAAGNGKHQKSRLGHCVHACVHAYYLGRFLGACHEQKKVCCMAGSDFDCMLQQICQEVT